MTHGHELKGGNVGGRGYAGRRGVKGGKRNNCNSIINKIYIKKKNYTISLIRRLTIAKVSILPKLSHRFKTFHIEIPASDFQKYREGKNPV